MRYAQVILAVTVLSGLPHQQPALAASSATEMTSGEHHWEAPASARRLSPPGPLTPALALRGAHLFAQFCAACHGAQGEGRGWLAGNLTRIPPDPGRSAARPAPGELFWKLSTGRGLMPGWRDVLNPAERWALTAHLASKAPNWGAKPREPGNHD